MKTVGRQLDPHRKSKAVEDFERSLRSKIIGQSEAVDAMVSVYQTFKAGMSPTNRPIGNLLFLGPTGAGKTRVVEAAAEVLFGSEDACIKVDCTEFIHSHEISKLTGCFHPDSRVMMADGRGKPINQVVQGDLVIGEGGVPRRVVQTYEYQYTGTLRKIFVGNSNIPIVCTPQHEIGALIWPYSKKRSTTKQGRNFY